jgi:hypothetical protein
MSLFDQVSSPYGVGAAPFRPPIQSIQPNDTVMSAVSRGAIPANVVTSGFGVINSTGGRPIINCLADSNPCNGSHVAIVLNGGSPNGVAAGGAGPGAGGLNQTQTPSGGCAHPMPHSMQASSVTYTGGTLTPNYQG